MAPTRTTARRTPTRSRRRAPGRRRRPARRSGPPVRVYRPRWSGGRWWPAVLIAVAVLAGVTWQQARSAVPADAGGCSVPGSSVRITAEQARNAEVIAGVAHERGLPQRAVVIALATAQQESRLRNLDYGDRDSLGLFQQRPSQGWGTEAQVQDPEYAAGKFYDGLVRVRGWQEGRLTEVAQAVQRSGFPEAYQQWEPMAQALTTALDPSGDAPLVCR